MIKADKVSPEASTIQNLTPRELEIDLRQAVSDMDFEVHYQPQIILRTRRISGFEALLRWDHPRIGAVSPSQFIPVAEHLGLINALGKWVLVQACQAASTWPDDVRVAVNVSPTQLSNGALPEIVAEALSATGLHPSRLELEITERILIQRDVATLSALQALRKSGVRIVIDDFGVGYSSLAYLPRFRFDKIKIDRSFIGSLGQTDDSSSVVLAIIRALVGLCANLGMACTAEGVETDEQLAVLSSENCPEVQGHLFSQAMPARAVRHFLLQQNGMLPVAEISAPPSTGISFFQIAQTANDIIIVTTANLKPPGPAIVYVNPAFTRLTGYSVSEAVGMTPRILQGAGTNRTTLDAIANELKRGNAVHEKVLNYNKGGAPYWLDLRIVPLRDSEGTITHFAAIERDITLDKRRLDELEFAADRDVLTGIANRRALLRIMEVEIKSTHRRRRDLPSSKHPCLAFIDVDRFKTVNDTKGHSTGDALLLGLADRLTENVRRSDLVGRIGGEEFAVWMPSVLLHEGRAIAERLREAVASAPFESMSGPISVTVSIGVAALETSESLKELMQRADEAMYRAKRAGRDRVMIHDNRVEGG